MGVPASLNIRIGDRLGPSASGLIWLFTWLVIIGHPVTSFFYWGFVLEAGILRHDADRIGLPIFADLIGAMIVAIPMLALTKLAFVFKAGPFRLWSWNRRRPILSAIWSLGTGVPAIYLMVLSIGDFVDPKPWYSYVWFPHIAALIAWLFILRGASLSGAPSP